MVQVGILKACVVISIYNNIKDIPALTSSLRQQKLDGHEMEVIVRDDGSHDRGADWIQENHQWIKIIKGSNVGFSRSNNIAASESTGEVLAFVNSDTILDHGYIAAGLNTLAKNPEAGGVNSNMIMPWIISPDAFLGGERPKTGYEYKLSKWGYAVYSQCKSKIKPTDFLSGGGCFVRKAALEGSAPFTESLWGDTSYCEDLELALRILSNGWSLLYDPCAVIYHNQRRMNTLGLQELLKFIKVSLNRFNVYAESLDHASFFYLLPDLLAGVSRKIETLDVPVTYRKILKLCGWSTLPFFSLFLPFWIYLNLFQGTKKRISFRDIFIPMNETLDI